MPGSQANVDQQALSVVRSKMLLTRQNTPHIVHDSPGQKLLEAAEEEKWLSLAAAA